MIRKINCNKCLTISQGMTLVELLIAVSIIGILSAVAYPAYQNFVMESHRDVAVADIAKIQLALEHGYDGSYSDADIISGGTCLICDSDTSRYSLEINLSHADYVYVVGAIAQGVQTNDVCGSLTGLPDGSINGSANCSL
ncbi:prepilin-type N-terminal cleavage/methylation domain-containing protein [Vibrio sp.]|nr:prepilin-type N-terminal cleavage/methylation domain-containing protein [Vibrio sp.]